MSNKWQEKMYDEEGIIADLTSKYAISDAKSLVKILDVILKLKTPADILDVACGAGRHSYLFAKKGHRVTGIDINSSCLKIATKYFKLPNLRYLKGNMATLQYKKGEFDLLLNLYNSFGYFSTDRQNERVLRGFVKAVKPGGKVVIQIWLRPHAKPFLNSFWSEDKYRIWTSITEFNKKTFYRQAWELIVNKDTMIANRYYWRTRVYSACEMVSLMRKCGLVNVKAYDYQSGTKIKKNSDRGIFVGSVAG